MRFLWEKCQMSRCDPIFLLILFAVQITPAGAGEISGFVSVEGTLFVNDPLYDRQVRDNLSIAMQPEYYREFKGGGFVFTPFARLDSQDEERTHFDIRELYIMWFGDNWEIRLGAGKVFWGVTESQHLVDIINQTDSVESVDGEEKLGQPMVYLSLPRDWGTLEFFVLPYFRERTFPGKKGRLRFDPVIDTDRAIYESGDEERHVDGAIRYTHTIGDWDIGLSHFHGTGRDPSLLLGFDANFQPLLIPYYEQIDQTGIDIQATKEEWLYKLEAIYRSGQGDSYYAFTAGFEYTFAGVTKSGVDFGALAEWLYDDRGDTATTPFEHEIMIGGRIAFNDAEGTEFLAGFINDYETDAKQLFVESSRRVGERWKVELEILMLLNPSLNDKLYGLRDDDFARLTLSYYY